MFTKKSFVHDKGGDAHYDVLSAFQKSVRGSDVNAALHYLARLIEAGDLQSIGRRLLIMAYEDIGLASPQAGPRTLAAIESAERVDSQRRAYHLQMPLLSFAYHQNQTQLIKHLMPPYTIYVTVKQAIFQVI